MQPLAGLAQFTPLARQTRKLGSALISVPRRDGYSDLGGLKKEDLFGHKIRTTLDQPLPHLECQPLHGKPTSSHVEERLLSVRSEALRPAEQHAEQFPTEWIVMLWPGS